MIYHLSDLWQAGSAASICIDMQANSRLSVGICNGVVSDIVIDICHIISSVCIRRKESWLLLIGISQLCQTSLQNLEHAASLRVTVNTADLARSPVDQDDFEDVVVDEDMTCLLVSLEVFNEQVEIAIEAGLRFSTEADLLIKGNGLGRFGHTQ